MKPQVMQRTGDLDDLTAELRRVFDRSEFARSEDAAAHAALGVTHRAVKLLLASGAAPARKRVRVCSLGIVCAPCPAECDTPGARPVHPTARRRLRAVPAPVPAAAG